MMRERLIELLKYAERKKTFEEMVDYLLANGGAVCNRAESQKIELRCAIVLVPKEGTAVMTDEQVIKAFEMCYGFVLSDEADCALCPYCDYNIHKKCTEELGKDILDLINRQMAEIKEIKPYAECRPIGCPRCHRGCFDIDKFCPHCGVKLPAKGGLEG